MSYSPTTSDTIRVTTDFGLDSNYGNNLGTEDIEVTASNYKDAAYQTEAVSAGNTQRGTITNTDIYKMLNVQVPDVLTKTNYVATNGVTYQYKVTATHGNTSASTHEIVYTSTWGVGNYNNTWGTTHTLELTTSNYNTANITTTNRATQATNTEAYLNTLIGTFTAPSSVTETYTDAPSGITYYIKTTFSGSNANVAATSGTLSATTTWGTSSGSYDHSFTDGNANSITITPSNFANRNTLIAAIGTTQRTNLKNYLDTLIGSVSTPADKTATFSTASGKTFYVKTTFTGSNNTEVATSCTIKYTTVYGLTNSYGNTLSTNVEFLVTPENYKTWSTDLTSEVNVEQAKIKNLNSYKMLNLALPSAATNTNYVATNGVTYQYKVTASNGTASLTERNIVYTTTWGIGNYNNTWATKHTLTLTTSNYSTADIITTNRTTQENATKDYLNTLIGTVATPSEITITYATNSGQTFYVKTTATGSSSSITATSCTLKYTTVYGLSNSYGNTLSTNVEFSIDANNYKTWTTDYASAVSTEQEKVKNLATYKMLNVALPSVVTNTNFVAANGITYQYKVTPTYGTCNLSKSEIVYTSTWGVGNYNNTWATKHTLTLTTSNYTTANITTTNRTIQVNNTEDYLNTFIGLISTPSQVTTTFSTASGKTFYVKTTATGSNNSTSATSCTLKYTTVYGLSNSYGNTLSSNIEFPISIDNYDTWESDYASAVAAEQDKIKDLATYKMLNVALPGVAFNMSYVATNGITYQYQVTATNGTCDLTQRNIVYTSTWGIGNYSNTWATKHTLKLTTSNYNTANITTTNRATQVSNTEAYLNTLIGTYSPPSSFTETYVNSPSGITYYIKTTYTGSNSSITATSGTLTATTTWGTTSGVYDQSYDDGNTNNITVTPSNFTNRNSLIADIGSTQRTNLKNYLDTLIGGISIPADKTDTFSTASGKTFYVKTTFSGGSTTTTSTNTVIKYTTVYGLSTSYGNTLSSNVEFIVTPDNYNTWEGEIATDVTAEQAKVKNLATYKMLNISLPSSHSDTYTAVNGKTYSFTTSYTQGTADLTQNNIICTTNYTRQDKTVKTFNSTTRKITPTTYSTASTNLASDMNTQEQNLKDYLDTLLVMPTKYSSIYTKGGFNYYFEIYYTIPDEESHDVTATAKVDLLTLKSSTVSCSNMADFNTKKTTMQSTKISELEYAVSDSPLNSSTTTRGLNIKTTYTKNAIESSSIDGSVYGNITVEGYVVYGPINFGKLSTFTNYKFVYTTITNTLNEKINKITSSLNNSLPESGSYTYTYNSTSNFGCDISYTYDRNILQYSLSISVDGVNVITESQYLSVNEVFKIESRMKYLLSNYESKIRDVTPKDVEQTYNGITVSKKFTKSPSSNVVKCDLYVDGVKKHTYTETFDLSRETLKESLQTLGDGDYSEYVNNSKSLNISVSSSTTITSRNKTYNVYILTEKIGSKIRVFRVIGNMKTNYIDVDINYLNANATKSAVQTAANRLLSNLDTIIDFYRPPSEAALIELMKVTTI